MSKRRLVFVINTDDDADILDWWEQQDNKSAAVRAAIRATMGVKPAPAAEPVTVAALRQVIREELAQVELQAAHTDPGTADTTVTEDVDPAAAARLDAMF
jgi:hypothetical protein